MTDYYLYSIVLENCPYSNAARKMLESHSNSNINKHIKTVNSTNKDDYKTSEIHTFPQIYLKRNGHNGSLLIGGYTDLQEIFNLFHKKKYSSETVNKFIEKNKKWSKKSLLRFISLINTK